MTGNIDPLKDVRVVDLTRILAGPYATMILGDLGADVIKVERPGRGDDTRHWGPPFVDGTATYYLAINRQKRSIAIDLKSADGCGIVYRLLSEADVVVSNFSPGVMERLGLGHAQLADTFPGLICCSITGHPEGDPRAQRPSFDLVIQAETGLMDLTGHPDGPATKVGISIADELAGLYLVQGILAALYHRERTGEGRPVNVALNEAVLAAFTYQGQQHLSGGAPPTRMGNEHPSLAPYRAYRASDGDLVVGVANEGQWQRLCDVIGQPELASDPRFISNAARVERRAELEAILEECFEQRPRDTWIDLLRAASVPSGPVRTAGEALDREVQLESGLVQSMGDGLAMVGSPIRMGGSRQSSDRRPPGLGEHTDEVLAEAGYSAAEIAALRQRGVVE